MKTWTKLGFAILAALYAIVSHAATAPAFEWAVYQEGGPSTYAVNIIVTSEGYTADQKAQFLADAKTVIDGILAKEPWTTYASHINFYTSWVVSNQAGVSVVGGATVDTAFKATYNSALALSLSLNDSIAAAYIAAVPVTGHHLFIINSSVANGGESGVGGSYAVLLKGALVGFTGMPRTALHELGHQIGGLGDEYGYIETQFGPGVTYPNISMDVTNLPWAHWIDSSTPLPTPEALAAPDAPNYMERPEWYSLVGAFQDLKISTGYRPTFQSIMRGGSEYGPVDSEAMVLAFYKGTGPLISVAPNSTSVVIRAGQAQQFTAAAWALPTSITTTWYLDGSQYSTDHSVTLQANSVTAGVHTLKVAVKDTTTFVRKDPNKLLEDEFSWALTTGNVPIFTTQPVNVTTTVGQTAGFSVAVDSGGAAVTYTWKKNGQAIAGASGSTYSISSASSLDAGSYSVVAATSAGSATSNAVNLTVNPAPSSSSSSGSSGSGGGGAISVWGVFSLGFVALARLLRRHPTTA